MQPKLEQALVPPWDPPQPAPLYPQKPAWLLEKVNAFMFLNLVTPYPDSYSGVTGQCLGTSVVLTIEGASDIEWVEARDTAHHPAVPRTASQRMTQPECPQC